MRSTLGLALVASGAALLAAWFASRERSVGSVALPASWSTPTDKSAQPVALSTLSLTAEPVDTGALRTPARSSERLRRERGLHALVVDAQSGEPVSQAQAWLFALPSRGASFEVRPWLAFEDLEHRLARCDQSCPCDDAGRAWFRRQSNDALVLARAADGRLGWGISKGDGGGPLRVDLSSDFDLEVLVRERSGRPAAGVEVLLRRMQTVASDFQSERTDRAGRVVLRHCGLALARPDGTWWVQLACASSAPSAHQLQRGSAIARPVELELPPNGSVELRLRDRNGSPYRGAVRAMLRSRSVQEPRESLERYPTQHSTPLTPASDARIEFSHVALNEEFTATLVHPTFERTATIAGPTQPGQRVVVELEAFGAVTWVGRAVDELGRPWPGALVLRGDEGSETLSPRFEVEVTPGARGEFRLETARELPLGGPNALTVVAIGAGGAELAAGRAFVRGGRAFEDLGEIVLSRVRPLAAGLVVDWRGEPVEGARVALVESARESYPTTRHPFVTYTDSQGRFELRYALGDEFVALQASLGGVASEPLEAVAGSEDLQLVLPWRGEVRGELLNGPQLRSMGSHIVVALTPAGAGAEDLESRVITTHADSRFRLVGLPAGAWDLVVCASLSPSQTRELARAPGVVQLDEAHPDVDAGAFDLLALLAPIQVRVSAGADGQPWCWLEISAQQCSHAGQPRWSLTHSGSSLLVPRALAPFDLTVRSNGSLHAQLANVDADVSIDLTPEPKIQAVLAAAAPPLPAHLCYWAALAPCDSAAPPTDYRCFDEGGNWRGRATHLGPMRLAIAVGPRARGPALDVHPLAITEWLKLELTHSGPVRVDVSPSSAAVELAVRAVLVRQSLR